MSDTQLLTAQEGTSVMEEELPREAQEKPSIPGPGAAAPEQLASSDLTLPKSLPKSREKPNLLARVMCRLGAHQGEWRYLLKENCSQLQECRRCGTAQARMKHKLEWRYVGNGTCQQVKTCRRCNIVPKKSVYVDVPGYRCYVDAPVGYRIRHEQWSAWRSIAPDSYIQSRHCTRCGKAETQDTTPCDD